MNKEMILKEMCEVIKKNQITDLGKFYYYPDISEKVKGKIAVHYDKNINSNDIIAFHDETLSGNGKNGLVFMLNGLYVRGVMEKPCYFNYCDIRDIVISLDKKGAYKATDMEVILKNNITLKITSTYYQKDKLKNILENFIRLVEKNSTISNKVSGEVRDVMLPKEEQEKCEAIIHTAAVAAGGVGTGLAQIPMADNAVITPIQITMITSLGAVFGIRVTESLAKGLIGSCATSIAGRSAVQLLVGWVPGLGNAINTATAAGLTEVIGWMAAKHFFELQQQDKAKYRVDGMKAGYEAASSEYEEKLRKQAEDFFNQKRDFEKERDEYERLLSEYEAYIAELERKRSNLNTINNIKLTYDRLKNLSIA